MDKNATRRKNPFVSEEYVIYLLNSFDLVLFYLFFLSASCLTNRRLLGNHWRLYKEQSIVALVFLIWFCPYLMAKIILISALFD